MVFTCVLQSASAAVGILQALASTGVITFAVAYPSPWASPSGPALPVLLSSLGANIDGKRTAFVYLLIDVLGVVIWGTVFYAVNAAVHFSFLETVLSSMNIALLNTPLPPGHGGGAHPLHRPAGEDGLPPSPNRGPVGPEEEDFARLESRFIQHPCPGH